MSRVTVVLEALRDAVFSDDSPRIYGLRRDAEDLLQILSARPDDVLNPIATVHRAPFGANLIEVYLDGSSVWLELDEPIVGNPALDLVELRAGLDSRRMGALAGDSLQSKRVTTFGGGSMGAQIALTLAQAGVGQHTVVDNDIMSASNISRHPCDLLDLGRKKADAVADLLRRRGAQVIASFADVCSLPEPELDRLTGNSDLVVIAMDSPQAQFLVNESCVRTGTPAVAAAAYERACGGEIVCIQPGIGPCLYCATGFRAGLAPAVAVRERRQIYQSADANRLVAEPGLAADIASIAAMATAYALAILDPDGSRAALLNPAKSFVLVHGGSAPRGDFVDLFQGPFDLVYAQVTRDEPCAVCGWIGR